MKDMRREVLYDRSEIAARVKELAREISCDYQGRELIVIGVLKGAFIFMADLIRALSIPCRIDFIKVASYGAGKESSGEIRMTKDIEIELAGRDVLIVEDIVDNLKLCG